MIRCGLCTELCPVGEEHHKIPQAFGGSDEQHNLTDICPNCHRLIHAVALKLISNSGAASSLVSTKWMPGSPKYQLCFSLARTIADKIIEPDEVETKQVRLNLSPGTILKLKEQSRAAGETSYVRFIQAILDRQANLQIGRKL